MSGDTSYTTGCRIHYQQQQAKSQVNGKDRQLKARSKINAQTKYVNPQT